MFCFGNKPTSPKMRSAINLYKKIKIETETKKTAVKEKAIFAKKKQPEEKSQMIVVANSANDLMKKDGEYLRS